eukprot:SAG22_NODE_2703_length_2298_cov_1.492042_3_plen_233_part_01
MLFVSAGAIFATYKSVWIVLLVIELINVALFFFLFISVVMAVIIATGTRDPVYEGVVSSWTDGGHKVLVTSGACSASGPDCTEWDKAAMNEPPYAFGTCQSSVIETKLLATWYSYNCANITADMSRKCSDVDMENCEAKCADMEAMCVKCEQQCQHEAVQNIKDYIVPAAVTCFIVTLFLIVAVVYNIILVNKDESTNEGLGMQIGLGVNGLLLLSGLVLMLIGVVGMSNANS